MKNKILAAALAALMILTLLGGCQLAIPDEETDDKGVLCGVFITLNYLDSSEPEISMNWKGEPEFTFPEQRIYATRHEEGNGMVQYSFDGMEGFSFYSLMIGEGQEAYHTSVIDGPIQDGLTSVSNEGVSLSGTIYFDVHIPDITIYLNPVYQTQDGRVYMVPGTGAGMSTMGEGDNITVTLSETATETVDGEPTSRTVDIKITAQSLNTNQKVVIKQMDEADRVIAQTGIMKDRIHESIQVLPDCAYMIMEEHCVDYEGNTAVKRTLLEPDETYVNVRFTGDNGIVQAYMVNLEKAEGAQGA